MYCSQTFTVAHQQSCCLGRLCLAVLQGTGCSPPGEPLVLFIGCVIGVLFLFLVLVSAVNFLFGVIVYIIKKIAI